MQSFAPTNSVILSERKPSLRGERERRTYAFCSAGVPPGPPAPVFGAMGWLAGCREGILPSQVLSVLWRGRPRPRIPAAERARVGPQHRI